MGAHGAQVLAGLWALRARHSACPTCRPGHPDGCLPDPEGVQVSAEPLMFQVPKRKPPSMPTLGC